MKKYFKLLTVNTEIDTVHKGQELTYVVREVISEKYLFSRLKKYYNKINWLNNILTIKKYKTYLKYYYNLHKDELPHNVRNRNRGKLKEYSNVWYELYVSIVEESRFLPRALLNSSNPKLQAILSKQTKQFILD